MGAANNGGPAFPQVELDRISWQITDQHFGVSVRDYFAAKAMQAMITKSSGQDSTGGKDGVPLVTKYAYEYADAMLVERAK